MSAATESKRPAIRVRSRLFLVGHFPSKKPALLIAVTGRGRHGIPNWILKRYDDVFVMKLPDVDIPDLCRDTSCRVVATAKNIYAATAGHETLKPGELEKQVSDLVKKLKQCEWGEVVVSCTFGVSRSPALAAFIADFVGMPDMSRDLRERHRFYNRALYRVLCKTAGIVADSDVEESFDEKLSVPVSEQLIRSYGYGF